MVQESQRRSAEAHRATAQEVAKISASETDRSKAEQLLDEHQRDFDIHYEENREKLEEIGRTVRQSEYSLPQQYLSLFRSTVLLPQSLRSTVRFVGRKVRKLAMPCAVVPLLLVHIVVEVHVPAL